jgi:endonuclease/exonuclease/phosphatase family metal-dependent hydrolase
MKTFVKIIAGIILLAVLIFGFLIIYATLDDYKPKIQELVFKSDNPDTYPGLSEIDILIWNIGYCGLSDDMDFFYDGGKQVRTSKKNVLRNLESVINLLKTNDTLEFILLQEVDKNSKRSYHINEYDSINNRLSGYWSFFGKNYDVFFVPLPPNEPMGSVESGLQTLSRYVPGNSSRWSFPGKFGWPKSLFMLDRCFLVNRYPLRNGKELLIINTHNSAYDGGALKKHEMAYLQKWLMDEYAKGNYIIVGGDWNQSPPAFKPEYIDNVFDDVDFALIANDFMPDGWQWVYDPKVPSNRRVISPYVKGKTPTTVIDFLLISPNIEKKNVETINLDFKYSDHQPVLAKLKLIMVDSNVKQ